MCYLIGTRGHLPFVLPVNFSAMQVVTMFRGFGGIIYTLIVVEENRGIEAFLGILYV